jgi:hypothetical protein
LEGSGDPSAAFSLCRPLATGGSQTSHHDRGDQEHGQLDHVTGMCDGEMVARRDEQVIERQHAENRRC